MDRRRFLLTPLAGVLAGPLAAEGQPTGKVARVGRLVPASASGTRDSSVALQQAMRDRGWVEGQNLVLEYRYAEGDPARLPRLAADLVRLKVDVIVTGSTPAVRAAKAATATIPIVMVTAGDPVAQGLVTSLARPGGNVTGVTTLGQELSGKQLEVLREAVPGVTRVAILANPAHPETALSVQAAETAARAMGIHLRVVEARGLADLEKAFEVMTRERREALMVLSDITLNVNRKQVVALAAKTRLPTIYGLRGYVEDGGFMFYGASLPAMYHQAAAFVDKILKGAKPADLPIEQPNKLELVIHLKTAKALGLTIPPSLLARADQVIE